MIAIQSGWAVFTIGGIGLSVGIKKPPNQKAVFADNVFRITQLVHRLRLYSLGLL